MSLDAANASSPSMCRRLSSDVLVRSVNNFEPETDGLSRPVCDGASTASAYHPTVSSRCSVRLLHDIISKFNSQKVDLVRSIGFDGLLQLPLLKQINLKFSKWLMTRVDEPSNSLIFSEGTSIEFNKHDVARVFGIPARGFLINSTPPLMHGGSSEAAVSGNPSVPAHFRSIKAAREIVSKPVDSNMNSIQQDEFRAAFVVLVMSTLLAPSAKHDRVSDDYLHAIQNPRKISSFDWADFVLHRLLDAVAKLKLDIANNVKAPYIYGCSLFLQILYLDSIDLGSLSMPHDDFPRIRCFTSERIRAMIAADPSFNINGFSMDVVCKTQLRNPTGVCYHWARLPRTQRVFAPQESRLLSLWQFSLSMSRVLKIAPEAAGPLFIAASGYCSEALKFMDLLLRLIEPYMNGFSYRPSISLQSRPFDYCRSSSPDGCNDPKCCSHFVTVRCKRKFSNVNAESSSSCSKSSALRYPDLGPVTGRSFTMGCGRRMLGAGGYAHPGVVEEASSGHTALEEVDIQAICEMARFYLQLSPVKPTRCSDLNLTPQHDDSGFSVPPSCRSCVQDQPRTPWQLGFRWSLNLRMSGEILNKLAVVDEIDEPWIAHFCPKYIEVATRAVKEQFSGKSELELEMVDAAIRRFKQFDDEMYANNGSARWRHYVESDFMVCLLAGCFNLLDPVQRAHFCGRHIKYDVTSCRMLIFPVILQYRWACFAWRMEDNTIVVYDPCCYLPTQSDPSNIYARVAKLLRSAMAMVSSTLFDGWSHDWQDARLEVYKECNYPPSQQIWNRSGLMCLHFCRCYDGSKIVPSLDMGHMDALSGMLLADVSGLSGNFGVVPYCIRQILANQIYYEA